MAQKIVIPLVLFLSAGAAVPFFLIPYERLAHTCTDPFRVMNITDFESEKFTTNLYSTVVTVFTYILPVRIDIELVSQLSQRLSWHLSQELCHCNAEYPSYYVNSGVKQYWAWTVLRREST